MDDLVVFDEKARAVFNHDLRELLIEAIRGPRAGDLLSEARHLVISGLQRGTLEVKSISSAGEMRWGRRGDDRR